MKRRKAQQVASRKKPKLESKTLNPFEVKVNRKKHDILGQKSKSDRGLPGVARSKGIQKRKKTLLKEYRQAHKTNHFIDRRIGENNEDLSPEERLMQRFIRQKQRKSEKAHLFSLEDDDLTHYGQSLADMDDFDQIQISSDSEDSVKMEDRHFGGFLTKKKSSHKSYMEEEEGSKKRSHKEIMEEIVAKSKAAKFEKQEVRRQVEGLLDEVDKEWKEIREVVAKDTASNRLKSKGECVAEEKKKLEKLEGESDKKTSDDYDKFMRELAFEPKGKASNRLKSKEECVAEEKRKLEKLESERIDRMKQTHVLRDKSEKDYVSADALLSGSSKKGDSRIMLAYKDGEAVVDLRGGISSQDTKKISRESINSHSEDEECDGDSDSDSGGDGSGDSIGHISDTDEELKSDSDGGEADSDVSDSDSNPAERFGSDLDSSCDEEGPSLPLHTSLVQAKDSLTTNEEAVDTSIPYTFEVPSSVEELRGILASRTPQECDVIVGWIHDCHRRSSSPSNRAKLKGFLDTLVYYVLEECKDPDKVKLSVVDQLSKHICILGQMNPGHSAVLFQSLLNTYVKKEFDCSKERSFPSCSKLMVFKLIAILFPTSDYNHPVATPAEMLMGRILSKCTISTMADCAKALLLCQLFMEYESLSKRFVPEVVSTLSLLLLRINEATSKDLKSVSFLKLESPQPPSNSCSSLLDLVASTHSRLSSSPPSESWCVLRILLLLVKESVRLWSKLPSVVEIFSPILQHLNRLQEEVDLEDGDITELFDDVKARLESVCSSKKERLQMLKQKPKSITFHEPMFDEGFVVGRRKSHSRTDSERQRLIHKVRKEKKGAVREIRKDNQFLAQQKLKEQIQRDTERQRKVREIIGDLAMQQADLKTERRKHKREV